MHVEAIAGDITTEAVDAIVNAANPGLLGGGGVDGAIHAAGGPDILRECRRIKQDLPGGLLPRGQAVATTAGRLPARWVIHTAGPVYDAGKDRSPILRSCYVESLSLAAQLGATSIAFPAISAGVYGWPIDDAARIALSAVRDTEASGIQLVRFALFGELALQAFARALIDTVPHRQAPD
ncbi:MAG: O-acetyl-ADP-ribose deacetylase [Geodermatophilaceae bacterium]|nr:O-acetyl-ADP-ribose deacetylase [Geodermatophilaceae bacterium]